MHRLTRRLVLFALVALAGPPTLAADAPASAGPPKVLRYAFEAATDGFDPPSINNLYSAIVTANIFEALYRYDYLARPIKIRPLLADGEPVITDDYKTFTVKLKPGIYFADDPVFGGKKREVTAQDFIYSYERFVDPATKSPGASTVLEAKILGLEGLREKALKTHEPFDYIAPVEGLRALDRYTLQFRIAETRPRFVEALMTGNAAYGVVAREVIEKYGTDIAAHPVGTGPFKLAEWRRSSKIVLARNPDYRPVFYDAEPAADDAEGQALLARFKGRRLPMIDRVEVSIIEETQPRWLAFLDHQLDFIELPYNFAGIALPGNHLAPNLARQGIQLARTLDAEEAFMYFNMEDPLVGGYTADKVALRRAIGLGSDVAREISVLYHGQALQAQSIINPHTSGYDPKFRSENGDYDPARAKALLDVFGYVDKNGDGWRDQPDGRPLLLQVATYPDLFFRQRDELWQKDMARIGLRVHFNPAQFPEQLKAARAGKLMIWQLGSSAASSDGQDALANLYGPQSGNGNFARFKNAEFDRLYERSRSLPDGPEREATLLQAKKLAIAYMPYKVHFHRILNDLLQPWVIGYRRPLFWFDFWQMIDIDDSQRPAHP